MNLIDAVNAVKKRIDNYGDEIYHNETATRYALIDPILNVLGWDVSDRSLVKPEKSGESGRVDYICGNRVIVVEAKKLDDDNLQRHQKQLLRYMTEHSTKYGIVTNGMKWLVYAPESERKTGTLFDFDIKADTLDYIVPNMVKLHKNLLLHACMNGGQRAAERIMMPDSESSGKDAVKPALTKTRLTAKLSEIKYKRGIKPAELYCQGKKFDVDSWIGVLANVAKYLIDGGVMNASNCPVIIGPKQCVLNTMPYHQTGVKMRHSKNVSGMHLNTNMDPAGVIKSTIKLIKTARLNVDDFSITADQEPY